MRTQERRQGECEKGSEETLRPLRATTCQVDLSYRTRLNVKCGSVNNNEGDSCVSPHSKV